MNDDRRTKKAAVIIVAYNAEKYLTDCLGSLEGMEAPEHDIEVVVVDNDSSDGTVAAIREGYPWVTLIESDENLGFAGGNNLGITHAIEGGAEYVFLLNQDAIAGKDFISEAIEVAAGDEKIGSVQSLLILSPETDRINSTGNAIHFLGFGFCEDYRALVAKTEISGPKEIAYASGAAVLYRASALKHVGSFDEELFLYHEDLDLGWRLRLCGYRNVLAPRSVVYHAYDFSRSISKYFYMERNRYIVMLKNMRLWTLILLLPGLLISEIGLTMSATLGGWWSKKMSASLYFLKPDSWRHIFEERDRMNRLRKISDRRLVRFFSATIRHQEVEHPFVRFVANPLMIIYWRIVRLLVI